MDRIVCAYHLHLASHRGLECLTALGSRYEIDGVLEEGSTMLGAPILAYTVIKHKDDDCDMSNCEAESIEPQD